MIHITFISMTGDSIDALKQYLKPHTNFTFSYLKTRLETADDLKYDVCM